MEAKEPIDRAHRALRRRASARRCAALLLLITAAATAPAWGGSAPRRAFDPFATLHRFDRAVVELRRQEAAFVAGADAMAAAIDEGADFAVGGSDAVRLDAAHRPGALLGNAGRAPRAGDAALVLVGLLGENDSEIDALLARVAELQRGGSTVIVLTHARRLAGLGRLDALKRHAAVTIDAGAGLPADHRLRPAVALAAAQALQVELFAACTRAGRTPVVEQSREIDTRGRRWLRYVGQRFHDDRRLAPVSEAELLGAYFDRVELLSLDLRTASGNAVAEAAWRCRAAAEAGGAVRLAGGSRAVFLGRYLAEAGGGGGGGAMRAWNGEAGPDDAVIAVGDADPPRWTWWKQLDAMRSAGLGVVWVQPGYDVRRDGLAPGDLLLDNQRPFGDASLRVAGYDARLAPLGTLANELILASLAAAIEDAASP